MASGSAIVKAVLSGDTIILQGRATNGPPPELQLSLSSLQAPKVARGPNSPEEPFGWQSREFLRRLAVGQAVTFKVDYKVAAINRDFGTITLNGESLNRAVAREGWARVKTAEQSRDGSSPELEELLRLEQQAQAEKKGMYSEDPAARAGATREVKWSDVDADSFLPEIKGRPARMVIEHVRDGASFRALVLQNFTYVNVNLAGVAAPRLNTPSKAQVAAGNTEAPKPEPFALESRHFTEVRLLQREVDVQVEGVDKYGTFYGTVLHPKGNISIELLKAGLARVVDYSIQYTSRDNALQYRIAERNAKNQQLKMWKGWTPQTLTLGSKEYMATVVEVVSGDTVVVAVDGGSGPIKEERKLSLASLRAPRPGNARRGQADEPWASEAKEFLRKLVGGKSVTVSVDYEREIPMGEKKEKRAFASLSVGKGQKKKNVSEAIVSEGFVQVIRHRQDEERAANYDDLIVAETQAKASKKGIHSQGEAPPAPRITDLSLDAKKARQYLPFLLRQRDIRAVVEYVFSGSRFKVYIPSENCSVLLAISSIRTPNPSRAPTDGSGPTSRGRTGDPFGEEARLFTRQALNQRTVEIDVHDMDKNGVALGNVITVASGSGEKGYYGRELVRLGFARVDPRGAQRLPPTVMDAILDAQTAAKAAKSGIWSVETEDEGKEDTSTVVQEETVTVRVSEIVDGSRCFLHFVRDSGLDTINQKMRSFTQEVGIDERLNFEPRRGSVVAALFDDGEGPLWYRARIEEKTPGQASYKVLYIDYGNRAVLVPEKMRPLDPSLVTIPAQAREAVLAFLRVPTLEEEFGEDAAITLQRLAWGKDLRCVIHAKDGTALVASLYEGDSKESINQALITQGVARVGKRVESLLRRLPPSATALVESLKEAQETARKGRVAMWRYGDVGDSDDEF